MQEIKELKTNKVVKCTLRINQINRAKPFIVNNQNRYRVDPYTQIESQISLVITKDKTQITLDLL